MSVFSSKKTQQGVYAAEEAKEKTQTESKQKFRGTYGSPRIRGLSGFTLRCRRFSCDRQDLTAVGSYVIFGEKIS